MNWISVKDRLPNRNGCYLVFRPHYHTNHGGSVTICYFGGTGAWYDDDKANFEELLSPTNVTHWMPLPEAPKELGL